LIVEAETSLIVEADQPTIAREYRSMARAT
jgi:hypothetical protein